MVTGGEFAVRPGGVARQRLSSVSGNEIGMALRPPVFLFLI
jgi:hypothetical protein